MPIGTQVIVPMLNKRIPIIADEYVQVRDRLHADGPPSLHADGPPSLIACRWTSAQEL